MYIVYTMNIIWIIDENVFISHAGLEFLHYKDLISEIIIKERNIGCK